jgi:N-acetylneuraminic acid mutarotase
MPVPLFAATLLLSPLLSWARLPAVPDAEGFAGVYAGTSGGALVLAGGANFPAGRPWEGGKKVWHDRVFVLPPGAEAWREVGTLPAPIGYGASVSHGDAVVCIGGSDTDTHHAAVFAIKWDGQKIQITTLPPLPEPRALHCAAVIGDRVFVTGGTTSSTAVEASRAMLSLDLNDPSAGWRRLPPCPGTGRILATAGVARGAFHLFGGADLVRGSSGQPERIWLRDAYRYDPESGWSRLPDLPRPAVAAASPAPDLGGGLLAILGGDDGSLLGHDSASHPGFRRDVLGFDPVVGRWGACGTMPFALVTTVAVPWEGGFVIPGGEARPGVRSPSVWRGMVTPQHHDSTPAR